MARTIWKFPLSPLDEQSVRVPQGARFLTAAAQDEQVCVWAEVDPAAPQEDRTIRISGTGHPLPDEPGAYLGTAMLRGGSLVLHVYG